LHEPPPCFRHARDELDVSLYQSRANSTRPINDVQRRRLDLRFRALIMFSLDA
jgi:hypothetical protein